MMNTPGLPGPMPDPHAGQPVAAAGVPLDQADAALILVHGRGAPAEGMLSLFARLDLPGVAALAPQAAGYTWYPQSFLAPLQANQPFLDSALNRLDTLVGSLIERGISSERIALLGFSQGACLTLEYSARSPRRRAAIIGLTGGLIGPPVTSREYPGSLDGTPVFLGTSDPDPHVPFERVQETRTILERMGAVVELRRYPGMAHTVNEDEIEACRALLQRVLA
ncbi:MAG: dienelactone hydrolase family protein [Chloroflexi bacterium]|nr:dienelactone hydrolase family protein [Chloroflexota bacterium]